MRILLINPNTTESVTALVAQHVTSVAGHDATFVPVTGRFGARYISTRASSAIAAHAALDAYATHGAGCDAVYLACFGDPGLMALREVAGVPVVGMAEASCIAAAKRGRFAIVTGGTLWKPMLTEFVASIGLADKLTGVRTIAPTGGEIATNPDAALTSLARACTACVTDDGADIVILGGAALAGLSDRIQPDVPVPVLCSVATGTHAAIAAAKRQCDDRASPPALESIGLSMELAALLQRK
ncbi:Asp/Glu racemase [Rhodopseudomonas boonkerdii]|uniref:aspartate/glutamate racemase family protein n=1 Tax=Rhodopseudomonas boonkerdii TaxID=475937 RepID=UPI001E2A6574|nr:aspartate/glutamate racemase family protein [Rhodopseudomonas boonkerdii]UGV28128.1 Asp/Glu racemase [Rhodopseudomonas boonkerdii]